MEVTKLLNRLVDDQSLESDLEASERAELLSACNRAKTRLESPLEAGRRIFFAPVLATAIRTCSYMGIFDAFAKAAPQDVSLTELTVDTKADPLFIARWLRVLVHGAVIEEVGTETYRPLPLAKSFASTSPFAAAIKHLEIDTVVLARMPAYFEERGYKSPLDAYDGPFQYATGTNEHYFDWVAQRPKEQAAFNSVMTWSMRNRGEEWFNVYPIADRLSADSAGPLIVDVGGGIGHDLSAFVARFPNLSGRIILQDLPSVISTIPSDPPLPSRIEPMAHDFFQPQPIKGARVYYMRTVLHDWPDSQAKRIIRNIVAAMDHASVLLISEKVMPAKGAPSSLVQADITMMLQFASLERTRVQWVALLEEARLHVSQIWEPREAFEGARTLFEARLK